MSPTRGKSDAKRAGEGFSREERAAIRARAQELKAEARVTRSREEGKKAVLGAIRQLGSADRELAVQFHDLVKSNAPGLMPKTWYGMPAYANADGKVICFFQAAR